MNKVWEKIENLEGKFRKKAHVLQEGGQTYQDTQSIADEIGDTLRQISSSQNYEQNFRTIKYNKEREGIDFSSGTFETYNTVFTIEDLKQAISETKCTTPGPDETHNHMLKNLHPRRLFLLPLLYKKIWFGKDSPPTWLKSNLIPIPKPVKDPSNPEGIDKCPL